MELEGIEKPIIRGCSSSKTRFLPEDVLVLILCRLPDKPLVRFKSVSKAWYLLISQICIQSLSILRRPPAVVGLFLRTFRLDSREHFYVTRISHHTFFTHFISDHLPERWIRRSYFLGHYSSLRERDSSVTDDEKARLFGWEECVSSFRLPFKADPDDLIGSCNGLLLFVDIDSSQYYVCNPLTRQCVSIPRPPWTQEKLLYAALAFDPSRSSSYKVVRFAWFPRQPNMVLDIYSSADKSWSSHSLQVDSRLRNMVRPATYFDGAFFRISLSWHVVRFDIEEVDMSFIDLPLSFKQCNGLMGSMGILSGLLCYANEYCDMIHIWSLEKCSKGWNLKYRINIHDLTCGLVLHKEGGPPKSKWVGPIAFHPSANVVYLGTSLVILSYNLDDNKLEELNRIEKGMFLPGCYCVAFTYVRFLAPFNEVGDICSALEIYNKMHDVGTMMRM